MVQLLDTTLRDGSNALERGFTEADIWHVASALAKSGIGHIEVGHGISVGIGQHRSGPEPTDERVLRIAREAAPGVRLGVIAVPALTTTGALAPLYEHLDFLRLAMAPHEAATCVPFVRDAVRRGKTVFVQIVKSHLYDDASFVASAQPAIDEGADTLYVVDTVGAMLPDEVAHYVHVLRDAFDVPIGFHGHNNCSGALANSLAAMTAGAEFIDATIGGLGRGAGNLQLELFVARLHGLDLCRGIDLTGLFTVSQYLWDRFDKVARGIDPVEVCFAIHRLDSTTRTQIDAVAQLGGINAFALIAQLAQHATEFFVKPGDIAAAAAALADAQVARSSIS